MPRSFPHITARCFVNVPFERLRLDLQRIIDFRLQPEIGLDDDVLYDRSRREFTEAADALKAAGLACTLHAPFSDLCPGAWDRCIRKASLDKLKLAFDLIPVFEPAAIVCHLNFEPHKHGSKQDEWFAQSMDTWLQLLAIASRHRTPLMLENTYETGPAMHVRILQALASPHARFCFDVGHTLAFARTPWQEWLPALTPWLGQLHLHDNHGDYDAHLAIGAGDFDFSGFFTYLQTLASRPIITLEPHSEKALLESLASLDRLGLFADSA
ncbi:MAG: hypothetical protein A2521_01690 [Deltaproteobacteria bacterium RIFOXYD12_FULL_57_12]|nr:MAG: hypothetical protein A2521_01690 [Deltaproteobacteria bacterium RIFOXYD12_FULL_57_12]